MDRNGAVLLENDGLNYKTEWRCEKWSEEAVDFARQKLSRMGITHIPGAVEIVVPHPTLRERVASKIVGREIAPAVVVRPKLMPIEAGISSEVLRRIVGAPEEVVEIEGNLLLNEGIQRLLDLGIAAVSNQVAGNAWNNGSSYIGVGDTSTAEAATQTELQAAQNAANRFYKAMNATYPSRSSQTVSWQSDFTSTEANFAWNEWTISAGATTASGSGFLVGTTNLNRKVQSLGTKSTGTWTMTGQVTLS